jgi:hypothetical protein
MRGHLEALDFGYLQLVKLSMKSSSNTPPALPASCRRSSSRSSPRHRSGSPAIALLAWLIETRLVGQISDLRLSRT